MNRGVDVAERGYDSSSPKDTTPPYTGKALSRIGFRPKSPMRSFGAIAGPGATRRTSGGSEREIPCGRASTGVVRETGQSWRQCTRDFVSGRYCICNKIALKLCPIAKAVRKPEENQDRGPVISPAIYGSQLHLMQ